jgi:dimethylamine monooxygenase subunit A
MEPLPFRDGPPSFTVGLRPIPVDRWLTPDDQAASLPAKADILAREGPGVLGASPGAEAGLAEIAALVAAALGAPAPDFAAASRLVSDDLCLMERLPAGWTLTAASLCSPTYFRLDHAIGKTLHELHGPVPGGAQLASRIARVFDGLRDGLVLERFNWTVQAGPDRYTPSRKPLHERALAAAETDARALLHLRVERQTIRRLPTTGGVVFTIRIRLAPLAELMAAGGDARAFSAAWASASADARGYKGWAVYDRLVAALCREIGVPAPERLEDGS